MSMHRTNRRMLTFDVREIYSMIIALLPVVMIFKVPFTGFGWATLLLGGLSFYPISRITVKGRKSALFFLIVFIMYVCLRTMGAGIEPILYAIALLHVIGASKGSLDMRIVRRTVEICSMFAAAIVILQTVLHYVLGINLQTLYDSILLEEYATTKGYSAKALFRPSGIFLEPAHFAQYAIIGLISLIERGRTKRRTEKILLIAVGILFSTSGIGIVLCAGAMLFLLWMKMKSTDKTKRVGQMVLYLMLISVICLGLMQIPFFQTALLRVFGDVDGYNAVDGRSVLWEVTVGTMQGRELLWGVGRNYQNDLGFMTGLNTVLYRFGWIGLALNAFAWLSLTINRLKSNYFQLATAIIYAGLFFSSDIVGFISIAFWYSVVASNDV